MNADSILVRLGESRSPSVSEGELKVLVTHINYLEKVCGELLRAITEARVRVNVPTKEVLRSWWPKDDAQARGDE